MRSPEMPQAEPSSPGLGVGRSITSPRGVGMAPRHRTPAGSSSRHSPRGPAASQDGYALDPGSGTGVLAQAARGADTAPEAVGHAWRRKSGHASGMPKNPSRLAPQQLIPPLVATQVNRSPAASIANPRVVPIEAPRTDWREHGTSRPSALQVEVAGAPSWPASSRPQQTA